MENEMMEIFSSALLMVILDLLMCAFIVGGAVLFVIVNVNYKPEAHKNEAEE